MDNNILNSDFNIQNFSAQGFRHRKLCFLVLFGIIFLTSGFGIPAFLGGTTTLLGCLALVFILAFCYKNIKINVSLLISIIFLILSILTTTIYHGDDIKQFFIYAVYIFIALILSQTMKTDFYAAFVKLFYFLSLFSLIMLGTYMLFPSIIRLLPIIRNRFGLPAHTAIFSTITSFGNMALPRNQGLFWEPGAYQTFINIAAAIVLFSKNFENIRMKYTIVFAITIFTTFSTTGYIVFCGLVLLYCLNEIFTAKTTNKLLRYIAILMLLIMVFFIVFSLLPNDIQFQLFGKLSSYFENTDKFSSTSVRVDAFKVGISSFLKQPLLGCGADLDATGTHANGLMTCTPVNYFAFYGLLVGVICNSGLFMFSKLLTGKTVVAIAVFICLSLATISENFMKDPIILSLIFLGLSKQKPKVNTGD